MLACALITAGLSTQAVADNAQAGPPGACSVLGSVYRTLDLSAIPLDDRQRLADTILDSCARTELQLLRAQTLGGVAVLEPSPQMFALGAEGDFLAEGE